MQKWEEIEQKKEYLEGYINSKNREALIKDQIQQLRLDTMFPALQGDGMPRGSSQKDLSDYTAKIENNNNPVDKWCLCNTAVDIDRNDNIQPIKTSKPRRRIDGTAALLDAYVVLQNNYNEYMSLI